MALRWAKALTGRALPVNYTTFTEIIRGQFDLNPVADHGADARSPHSARGIGDELMAIVQLDAEAPFRKYLLDQAIQHEEIFL